MATTSELFNVGLASQRSGNLEAAERAYREILRNSPEHIDALHLLGIILMQTGRAVEAVIHLRRAIHNRPNIAAFHNTLGNALQEQGEIQRAILAYQESLQLNPTAADVLYNLGTAQQELGQSNQAAEAFRKTIALQADFAPAHFNLANLLKDCGQCDEACIHYDQVNRLWPDFVGALNNWGAVLQEQGRLNEALIKYNQALANTPDCAETHYNIGCILIEQGRLDAAHESLDKALSLRPDYPEALVCQGSAYKSQGRIVEAIAAYRQAVKVAPENTLAWQNLLFSLHFSPNHSADEIAAEHRRWNDWFSSKFPPMQPNPTHDRVPHRRLRIGYVSGDFHSHAASLFTIPLLSHHNHRDYEIYCYSGVKSPDALTQRIQSQADHWRPVAEQSDTEVVDLIRQDRIDILVDLSMHMAKNRTIVFARKPAPIQICWLAYPGTTGLTSMDYRVTDPYLDPPGINTDCYAEKSICLPHSFWCYTPLDTATEVNALPAENQGYVTFGNLNDFGKINPDILKLWSRVLRNVPESRITLLALDGSHRNATIALFENEGIAKSRIQFMQPVPRCDYLNYYHGIDICLDTLPYNGHTTSFDSLWMGVPIVTRTGNTAVGRAGTCLLSNLDLTDLIADSDDKFVEIATNLSMNRSRLCQLRSNLRFRLEQSHLMNGSQFASDMETVFREVWVRWCQHRE